MKLGDLVTVELGRFKEYSNTFKVLALQDQTAFLNHPIAPECIIAKPLEELNKAVANRPIPFEKCLDFCRKNENLFSHTDVSDLDAICYFFIIKREINSKQRATINALCGKISSKVLSYSLQEAVTLIKSEKVLLDEFNTSLFNQYSYLIEDPTKLTKKNEKFVIFEMAGFILAQENS